MVLEASTLRTVHELDGGWPNWAPSWSADGQSVMLTSHGSVRMWWLGDPEPAEAFEYPLTNEPPGGMFVPGTDTIAVATGDRLDFHDRETGEIVDHVVAPTAITAFTLSHDGTKVAFADRPGRAVNVVTLDDSEPTVRLDHRDPQVLRFGPSGTTLSIGGNADSVSVFDLDGGAAVELRGHGTASWRHAPTPDGARLLSVSLDGGTRVWTLDPAGPAELGNVDMGGRAHGWLAADQGRVLVATESGPSTSRVVLHDLDAGTHRVVGEFWYQSFFWPVLSRDLSLVAGYDPDDMVATVLDVTSGDEVLRLGPCEKPEAIDAVNRTVIVVDLCTEPIVHAAPFDARQGLVDLETGRLVAAFDEPDIRSAVLGPADTPADDLLAYTTGPGGAFVLRRASSGAVLASWPIPPGMMPLSIQFSPDGERAALSAMSREVVVFDVEAIVSGVAIESSATVFDDLTTGPTNMVIPIGDLLVASGQGDQVAVWDPALGRALLDVPTSAGQFVVMVPLPDGSAVLYQDGDGVLRRLLLDPDDLVALARSRVQRGFTDAECSSFFPERDCPVAE